MRCKICKKYVPRLYREAHQRMHERKAIIEGASKLVESVKKALEPITKATDTFRQAGEAMAKAFSHFQPGFKEIKGNGIRTASDEIEDDPRLPWER